MITVVNKELELSAAQGYAVKCFLRDRLQKRLEHCAANLIAVQWQVLRLNKQREAAKEAAQEKEQTDAKLQGAQHSVQQYKLLHATATKKLKAAEEELKQREISIQASE